MADQRDLAVLGMQKQVREAEARIAELETRLVHMTTSKDEADTAYRRANAELIQRYEEAIRNLVLARRHDMTSKRPEDTAFEELLERARRIPMTDEQRREQAASFAYGQLALMSEYREASAEKLDELRIRCRRAAGLT